MLTPEALQEADDFGTVFDWDLTEAITNWLEETVRLGKFVDMQAKATAACLHIYERWHNEDLGRRTDYLSIYVLDEKSKAQIDCDVITSVLRDFDPEISDNRQVVSCEVVGGKVGGHLDFSGFTGSMVIERSVGDILADSDLEDLGPIIVP